MAKALKIAEPAFTVGWEISDGSENCANDSCRKRIPAGIRVIVERTTFNDDSGAFCSVNCQRTEALRFIRDAKASPDEFIEVEIGD